MASEQDKKVVLDAMRDLGTKDESTAKNVELILGKTRSKGPRYANKPFIAQMLQELQNEKKVIRKAGEKTSSYYLAPVQPVAPKPVTTAPTTEPAVTQAPQKSDNPYL